MSDLVLYLSITFTFVLFVALCVALLIKWSDSSAPSSKRPFSGTRNTTDVTPEQMGMVLVGAAYTSAFSEKEDVGNQILSSVPEIQDDVQSRFEILIFCLLPLDMIALEEFGPAGKEVRSHMLAAMRQFTRSMLTNPDQVPFPWDRVPEMTDEILVEYAEVLGKEWSQPGLQRLSLHAAKRITGDPDPLVAMLLAAAFTMALKHMPEAIRSYRIV